LPKRSNRFQRLIATIHHALADGATVEESRLLRDRVTGSSREVDVVIESAVGDYPVIVSIECSDRSRPATVEWVEQQHGKHANLPTNKLILVSRSGFTETATVKARLLDIETLSLVEAQAATWTTVVHKVQLVVLDATSVITMLFPCLEPRPRDQSCRPLSFDDVLVSPGGMWRIPVSQFADTLLYFPAIYSRTVASLRADSDAGWIVSFPVATESSVVSTDGTQRQLTGLGLVVLTKRRAVPLKLRAAGFREHQVAYGEASSDIGQLLLTVLEQQGATPRAVLLRQLGGFVETQSISGREILPAGLAPAEAMSAMMGRLSDAS
jgi:hypothetical protein